MPLIPNSRKIQTMFNDINKLLLLIVSTNKGIKICDFTFTLAKLYFQFCYLLASQKFLRRFHHVVQKLSSDLSKMVFLHFSLIVLFQIGFNGTVVINIYQFGPCTNRLWLLGQIILCCTSCLVQVIKIPFGMGKPCIWWSSISGISFYPDLVGQVNLISFIFFGSECSYVIHKINHTDS